MPTEPDDQFDRLPMLLNRAMVREVTGLSDATITELVEHGRLRVWRVREGSRKGKFYKCEIAKLIGMEAKR